MKRLSNSLMPPLQPVLKKIGWALLAVSLLGFIDAAYLSAKFYLGETPTCFLLKGCDVVTTSSYSSVAGVPIALFGALFYLAVFVLSLAFLDRRAPKLLKWIGAISVPGFLFTLYLVYLQFFVLHALCIYCMFSALTSTTVFVLALIGMRLLRRTQVNAV